MDLTTEWLYALVAEDLIDTIQGVLRTSDKDLWNGSDTDLAAPTTVKYDSFEEATQ